MSDPKQRLFEVMMKVNPSFKRINELGAKMAGIAINRNIGGDQRTQQISKDAVTSLFSKYVGKDIPFFMEVREGDKPTKYQLIEVTFGRDMSMRTEYSSIDNGGDYVLKLHFFNPTGEENDSPYAENKKEFVATYVLSKDAYNSPSDIYFYNQYAINLLLFAALTIRKAYFNAFPKYKKFRTDNHQGSSDMVLDQEATEAAMRTRLNKRSFRQFQFDSKSLDNRNHDKPEPPDYF